MKYKVKICDVGQACFCIMMPIDESRDFEWVLFDFGLSPQKIGNLRLLSRIIRNLPKNSVIVLSHFHYDHLSLIEHINVRPDCRWISPELTNEEKRILANYPIYSLVMAKMANGNEKSISKVSQLKIGEYYLCFSKGTGRTRNDSGIVSLITQKSEYVSNAREDILLIPGDCSYKCIDFGGKIRPRHLIASHHGSAKCNSFEGSTISLERLHTVFVPCGPHKGYKHPQREHLEQFERHKIFVSRFSGKISGIFDDTSLIKDDICSVMNDECFEIIL